MGNDTATQLAARRYVERGWTVLALHGLDAAGQVAQCTCREGAGCTSVGKHPVAQAWRGAGLTTIEDLALLPPWANVGILTGLLSRLWVLDVDPIHDGDKRLAELEAVHGPLPYTYQVRTGSGGYHYYFLLPADFTPTNSRGRLPVGLDVRGEGGQVVAPPSRSGVGEYSVAVESFVAEAPGWLLDLIRPAAPVERAPMTTYPSALWTHDDAHGRLLSAAVDPRLKAYADRAVLAEFETLRAAVPGSRGKTAYEVACSLIELANSPWTGYTTATVWGIYETAARAAMDLGGAFDEREMRESWASATRRVGANQRLLPRELGGTATAFALGGVPPHFGLGGMAGISAYPGPAQVVDNPVDNPSAQDPHTFRTVPHLRDYLLRRSQLSLIPRQVPLIRGVLNLNADTWLIGASGSGKSFVALDWACHVATGRDWNGKVTTQGTVLYVVAEGASGTQQRVRAWEGRNQVEVSDALVVLPMAVQAIVRTGRELTASPQWLQLMEVVTELTPSLIVLDTQARMSLGVNENDNGEMGAWIAAVSMLRAAHGACVLVVHHTGRSGGDARGASSIDAAQDMEWKVERVGSKSSMLGRLRLEKGKDTADADVEFRLALKVVELGWDEAVGDWVSSLIVSYDPFDQPDNGEPEHRTEGQAVQAEILSVLREGALSTGATKAEILRLINKARAERADRVGASFKPASERTVGYAIDDSSRNGGGLLQKGLVVQVGQRFADKDRFDGIVEE